MSKSLRILSIALITFSLFISFYSVYASDINMNLTADNTAQPGINNTTNSIVTDNTTDTSTQNQTQTQEPITQSPDTSTTDTPLNPSSVGAVPEEGLTFSNVLNILLITVGVVLIFLAIGIMIKLQ